MLYLQNICVDNETDEDIAYMVRDHAKQHGIRIMMHRVIRNRSYQDMVGVQILVPESQQHLALAPSTWPDELKCRLWTRDPPRIQRNYHTQEESAGGYGYEHYERDYDDRQRKSERKDKYDGRLREGYGATDHWGDAGYRNS